MKHHPFEWTSQSQWRIRKSYSNAFAQQYHTKRQSTVAFACPRVKPYMTEMEVTLSLESLIIESMSCGRRQ